ncbi:hypothetical protein WJX72_006696 [[Myrmecia] bisecta]|uniref:Endonuclease/exonuclease/phosphatase domain-containing protein n=1 Tax=[Myrmecia] bisecta TaxID=41462 RepID=A0AAW1P8H0_9CHLO
MNLVILSFNCWGLWLVAHKRAERLRHIGEYLQTSAADIVLLQEVWVREDADQTAQLASQGGLKHSVQFPTGMLGGELMVLSRFPIVQVRFEKYEAAGDPSALFQGDYFAGKGISYVRLMTPEGPVDVFNTHLGANYLHSYQGQVAEDVAYAIPEDPDGPVRVAQALQLADFIRAHVQQDSIATIAGGDFNAHPATLELELFRGCLPDLQDCWHVANPEAPGVTVNALDNTFTKPSRNDPPLRIDYIWSSSNACVKGAQVVLHNTTAGYSFSDHFGLQAEIEIGSGASKHADQTDRGGASLLERMKASPHPFQDALGLLHAGAERQPPA